MAITSQNIANAIVKLVAVDALPMLVGELAVGNLAYRDFEPQVAQAGDAVSVLGYGDASVLLETHAEATFQVPDVTKVLAVPDLLKLYMGPAIVALTERIEYDLLRLYSQFSNEPVGVGGAPLTEATVDAAETALFSAKAPANQPKYLVVDPRSYSSLRQSPRFVEYSSASEAGLRSFIEASIGKLGNFFVFRSPSVARIGSAPITTHNVAFAKNAIGLVTRRLAQPLPSTGLIGEYAEIGNFGIRVLMNYRPNTLTQQFTVDVLYGCAVLNAAHGVEVRS